MTSLLYTQSISTETNFILSQLLRELQRHMLISTCAQFA